MILKIKNIKKISKKQIEVDKICAAIKRYQDELNWYDDNWDKLSTEEQGMHCCIHCWSNNRIFYLEDQIKRTKGWLKALH